MESHCKVVLIDIHTLKTEIDDIIDLDEEISKLIKEDMFFVDDDFLDDKGIKLLFKTSFNVSDKDKFLSFIRKLIFPDSQIINCEGYKGGHPDFIIKKDGRVIYVEMKYKDDGLRLSQLQWFHQNKDKECKILFIDFVINSIYDNSSFGIQEEGTMLL